LLLAAILGKFVPNDLLKISRFRRIDGENGGETQLADYLVNGSVSVECSGPVGKQHGELSFVIVMVPF
jgi:hypothetical protein